MAHVMAPDLAGSIRKAVGVSVVARAQQQSRRIDCSRREHEHPCLKAARAVRPIGFERHDALPEPGDQPRDTRAGEQPHIGMRERGRHAAHFGIALGVQAARKTVAGITADARTARGMRVVAVHRQRQGKRMQALGAQCLINTLDSRLMRQRRVRISRARRLGGVGAGLAMSEVPILRLRVMGREIVVTDGPRRRLAIDVAAHGKIRQPPAQNRRAVKFGIAADVIAGDRGERFACAIQPLFIGVVAMRVEHGFGVPVDRFARQIIAALQYQNG